MASKSNAKLTAEILAIDADATTEGLTNDQLKAKLAELKNASTTPTAAEAAAAEAAAAEAAAAEAAAAEAAAAPAKGSLTVAEGRSVTSKRGILKAGDVVKEADFAGGKKDIKRLTDAGVLAKA